MGKIHESTGDFFNGDTIKAEWREVVDIRPMTLEVDVKFAGKFKDSEKKTAEGKLKGVTQKYRGLISKEVKRALPKVYDLYQKQQDSTPPETPDEAAAAESASAKAFKEAGTILDKLNRQLEKRLESIRIDYRTAVGEVVGIPAKDLETVALEDFTKLRILPGAFAAEESFEAKLDHDLIDALKTFKKVVYCATSATGTTAYLRLDKDKKIKDTDLRKLKTDYGGRIFNHGICKVSGSTITFRFKQGTGKLPQKDHLRKGIAEQIGENNKYHPEIGAPIDQIPKSRTELEDAFKK